MYIQNKRPAVRVRNNMNIKINNHSQGHNVRQTGVNYNEKQFAIS